MAKKENDSRRVAMAIITDHEDNMLMGFRNDKRGWTHPGGHIEKGEDPYEGMVRELKEETNIDVEHIQLVKACWIKEKKVLLYIFKVIPDPKSFITAENDPDKECNDWHYMDPNDIKEDLAVPAKDNEVIKYWANN